MQDRLNRNDTSDTDIIFDVYKGGGQFPWRAVLQIPCRCVQ